MTDMKNLVWLRSDLRIYDNPALYNAMLKGSTVAVYCLANQQWDNHGLSQIKRRLIVDHLFELEEQLAKLNVPLIVINCELFSNIPQRLIDLCNDLDINKIYYNYEYEVNEKSCSEDVVYQLAQIDIEAQGYHDQCIVAPGSILNGSSECYKVFSAFARNWLNNVLVLARPLYNKPNAQAELALTSNISCLKDYLLDVDTQTKDQWPIGEDEAHDRLNEFVEQGVSDYHNSRDFPDLDATSHLSVYLALGILTTRQCLQALVSHPKQDNDSLFKMSGEGEECWLNELIWREFYRHIMVAFPKVCKGKPFKDITDNLPWKTDNQHFQAWCQGKTGVPIVDAAMRQLNTTGWMHNRLRMIVAMFLTKHLLIDWRLGEAYFYGKLADADLASNNGGWQWSASTGVDAVPYFRIFNPYRQAERFDPKGDFIRTYIEELASLKGNAVLQPSKVQAMEHGYPTPIIDLKIAAVHTKALFKNLSVLTTAEGMNV
jgi:deoxyribodipyrimidine photo-lyase